jgi:hypothetical protein
MDAKGAADVSGPVILEEPVSNHSQLSYVLGDAVVLFSTPKLPCLLNLAVEPCHWADSVMCNFIILCSGENWNCTTSPVFALWIMISARWEIKNADNFSSGYMIYSRTTWSSAGEWEKQEVEHIVYSSVIY